MGLEDVHLLTGHDRMSDLDCHLSVEPDPESGPNAGSRAAIVSSDRHAVRLAFLSGAILIDVLGLAARAVARGPGPASVCGDRVHEPRACGYAGCVLVTGGSGLAARRA